MTTTRQIFKPFRNKLLYLLPTIAILLCGCGGGENKKRPVYVGVDDSGGYAETSSYAQSGDLVSVPFREESGVKYVEVEVNGVGFEMIFDTGCSTTLLSLAEANYLYQKGLLDESDILGTAQATVADGRVVENMVVNLKQVVIGGKILCTDVQAVVSGNVNAPLLLGNEVLNRVATITINNATSTLEFKLN